MSPDSDCPTRVLTFAVAAAILLAAVAAVAALRRRPVTAATPPPARLSAPAIVDAPPPYSHALRVCADLKILPFTNRQEAGFENAIGHIRGVRTGRRVENHRAPQRRWTFYPHDIEGRLLRRRPWCPRALRDGSPHQAVLPIDRPYVFVTRRGAPRGCGRSTIRG